VGPPTFAFFFAGWAADSLHDSIITVGNGGIEPARAQLTFYYDGGRDKYQVEQTLAPEEQMWLDLGQLIRDQVPGKDGKTIPPEVTSGVYQIKDLSHVVLGPLYEAKLIVDKTNGHAFYGCYQCCGDDGAVMGVVPIDVFVNGTLGQTVWSTSHCDGGPYNINSAMTSWWTNDATIATASNAQVHGVALGSTDNLAEGEISTSGFRQCGQMQGRPSGPTNVMPVVNITAPAPTAVPVAQAQPVSGKVVGDNEVYIGATCSPEGKVNPQYNWSITQGSDQVKLDPNLTGGPTMGIIGIKGGSPNGVIISVTCTDLNTKLTSTAKTATMTSQQPGSLTIAPPDNTSEKNCTVQGNAGCETDRSFTYQINDTNGTAMAFAGLDFWDYITTGTQNSCNVSSYSVTCSGSVTSGQQTGNCDAKAHTGASGQFSESLSVCATVCGSVQSGKCTGSCSTGSTQTWIVNGYPITKSLTYQCNSISVQ